MTPPEYDRRYWILAVLCVSLKLVGMAITITARSPARRSRSRGGRPSRRLFDMCRNITELRGLEPPATREEVEAAAKQFVRKVTGIAKPNPAITERCERAAAEIAAITEELLDEVPARRQPPKTVPPLRRPEVRKRLGLEPFPA